MFKPAIRLNQKDFDTINTRLDERSHGTLGDQVTGRISGKEGRRDSERVVSRTGDYYENRVSEEINDWVTDGGEISVGMQEQDKMTNRVRSAQNRVLETRKSDFDDFIGYDYQTELHRPHTTHRGKQDLKVEGRNVYSDSGRLGKDELSKKQHNKNREHHYLRKSDNKDSEEHRSYDDTERKHYMYERLEEGVKDKITKDKDKENSKIKDKEKKEKGKEKKYSDAYHSSELSSSSSSFSTSSSSSDSDSCDNDKKKRNKKKREKKKDKEKGKKKHQDKKSTDLDGGSLRKDGSSHGPRFNNDSGNFMFICQSKFLYFRPCNFFLLVQLI